MALGLPLGDAPAFFSAWGSWITTLISGTGKRIGKATLIDAARTTEKEKSAGSEPRRFGDSSPRLVGGRFDRRRIQHPPRPRKNRGACKGRQLGKTGRGELVMRRPLSSEEQENEAKLIPGRIQAISFAVWNGGEQRNGTGKGEPLVSTCVGSRHENIVYYSGPMGPTCRFFDLSVKMRPDSWQTCFRTIGLIMEPFRSKRALCL